MSPSPLERHGLATQAVVALASLLLLLAPLGADMVHAYRSGWGDAAPVRAEGRLAKVLAAQNRNRMINVSLALAARWAADGMPATFVLPRKLDTLARLPPDPSGAGTEKPAMQPSLTRLMVGPVLHQHDYDPRISSAAFDRLLGDGEVKAFPFHVFAIRADLAVSTRQVFPYYATSNLSWSLLSGQRLVAVADSGSDRIAVIPLPISPIGTCPMTPDSLEATGEQATSTSGGARDCASSPTAPLCTSAGTPW